MAKKGAKSGSMHGGWTKRNKIGFMYVSIWIFGFLLFQLYPFICSLVYSFTDYDIFSKPEFVGFANYIKLFTKDKEFWNSLIVTLKYTFITVPGKVVLALIIAVILNKNLKGINFIRTVYYIPSLLSGSVAVAILWKVLFMNDGFVNSLLGCFNIEPVKWLGTPDMALVTICMLEIWQFGSSMVLFLSALKQVPQSLYEAAEVDGASAPAKFFKISLPLLTPTIFFNLVMQMINGFLAFTQCYIITQGKPMNSTLLYTVYMYKQSFEFYNTGYGAALAWVMLAVIGLITLFLFATKRFWVYEGGL